MTERSRDQSPLLFRVGLTVFVAAVGLGVILFLAGNYHLLEDGYHLYVQFNYARGIEVGAPVLVSGVKLGQVEDVDFVYSENQSRVKLKLWILNKAVVKKDAKIYVKTLGLLGQPAIEITAGSAEAELVPPGNTLDGEEPFVMEEVLAMSQGVVEGLSKAVSLFNSILEEAGAKENIRATIKNLSSASSEFERTIRQNAVRIDAIARSLESASVQVEGFTAKGAKDIDSVIAELKSSSSELNLFLQQNRPKANDVMDNLARSASSLEKTLKDIRTAADKMSAGKSAAGVVFYDDAAAKNVRNLLKNMDDFSQDIKEHPWKLLRKP